MKPLGACLLLAGCLARNPATGRTEISFYSDTDEIALGLQATPSVVQESGGLFRDTALAAYVEEVGQRLVAVSDRPFIPPEDNTFRYRFHVLNSSEVNAFALPGGQIFVTRGILARLVDESELAAVLGHEIGHVAARHGVRHMQSAVGMDLLISLGAAIAKAREPDLAGVDAVADIARVGGAALQMKYSRDDEIQSDTLGMKYAGKAGYDPRGMIRVQDMLRALQRREPGLFEALFQSHPPSDARIESARRFLDERFANQNLDAAYARHAERFATRTASLRAVQPAYARYEEGMKHLRALQGGKVDLASSEGKHLAAAAHAAFSDAVAMDSRQAPFHAARGHLFFLEGDAERCAESLQRAIALDPDLFEPLFLDGIHLFSTGRLAASRARLDQAARTHPAHPGPYYYLGRVAEAEGKRNEALDHYARAAAAGPDTSYGREARARAGRL